CRLASTAGRRFGQHDHGPPRRGTGTSSAGAFAATSLCPVAAGPRVLHVVEVVHRVCRLVGVMCSGMHAMPTLPTGRTHAQESFFQFLAAGAVYCSQRSDGASVLARPT